MKILIVPDKFKGSSSASQICAAVQKGISESGISATVKSIPLADGGEGTCRILTHSNKGHEVTIPVADPLGRTVDASFGVANGGRTAYIEMAAASGLQLLKATERNPLITSTYGTGQMIRSAIQRGAKEIILGIGGSATNDAGTGMAAALGFKFLDKHGVPFDPKGGTLKLIGSIERTPEVNLLEDVSVTVLCDVNNPLYGENGAAHVFAPQKGADAITVKFLDDGLRHFASIVQRQYGIDLNFLGAGAAGGLGAGAALFLKGKMKNGIRYILDALQLDNEIRHADLIVTGEGKLDEQSISGKVVAGVCEICKKYNKPVLVVTGKNQLDQQQVNGLGDVTVLSLLNGTLSQREAMANAESLVQQVVQEFFKGKRG